MDKRIGLVCALLLSVMKQKKSNQERSRKYDGSSSFVDTGELLSVQSPGHAHYHVRGCAYVM